MDCLCLNNILLATVLSFNISIFEIQVFGNLDLSPTLNLLMCLMFWLSHIVYVSLQIISATIVILIPERDVTVSDSDKKVSLFYKYL